MSYKLAIFDLDGTILNTLDDLADAVNYALRKFHMRERTIDEVRKFVGNGIGKLIERAVEPGVTEEQVKNVLECFKDYYGKNCAVRTKPYEGICEAITSLRKSGIKTAVVSNKADFAVQGLVQQYFPNMFDFVVGERTGIRRKPSPDSVNETLTVLGINREDAVYIGDSDVDIETAYNAKMDVISVDWGFRSREFLTEHGAVRIVSDPSDLVALIEG